MAALLIIVLAPGAAVAAAPASVHELAAHNSNLKSGELDLTSYTSAASIAGSQARSRTRGGARLNRYGFAANYDIHGQNLKWTFQYQRVESKHNPALKPANVDFAAPG